MALTVSGYSLPSGVTTRDQIKQIQTNLGVKADGVWGPKTQAAYEAGNGSTAAQIPKTFMDYYGQLQTALAAPKLSFTPTSREDYAAQIQAALRPGYDLAIQQRREATKRSKAETDADAAARGMGSSTWVTDMKGQLSDAEAGDVATLESQYAAAQAEQLMNALQAEKALQYQYDALNASNAAAAQNNALNLASSFYSQYLQEQANKSRGGRSGSGGSSGTGDTERYTHDLYRSILQDAADEYTGGKQTSNTGKIAAGMLNNQDYLDYLTRVQGYSHSQIDEAKKQLKNYDQYR